MDFVEFQRGMKEEKLSEAEENENPNTAIDFHIKVEVKSEDFDPEELDWCLDNYEISEDKFVQSDSLITPNSGADVVVSFKELQALEFEECLLCHAVFTDRYSLLCHNLTHLIIPLSPARLYKCHRCLVCFTNKIKWLIHVKAKKCKVLGQKISFKTHKCEICSKKFSYKRWHAHMTDKHGMGSFDCSYCGYNFKCKRYLRQHIGRIHKWCNNNKVTAPGVPTVPLQCDLCPKSFKNKDCLGKHKKNCHSTPVECPTCKKALKSQWYLKSHIRRQHYDDGKEHKCEICFKKFRTKRLVGKHFRYAHIKKAVLHSK